MSNGFIALLFLVLLGVLAACYLWYVVIIKRRNSALEALSSIDVQLRKRHDLIPSILTIAQKFMDHERALLEEITSLRTSVQKDYDATQGEELKSHIKGEEKLGGLMGKLLVAVENYPDLKSADTMLEAQRSYNEVEAQISAARRFYNSAVRSLNNSVQIFPGNLVAAVVRVGDMPYFEIEEAAREPVSASDYLK